MYILRHRILLFLLALLVSGTALRTFRFADHHIFDIDQEIYSFIVKDIVVDNHLRLIGQQTSLDGFFVGAGFNYLLAPFFLLFQMHPLSVIFPVMIVSASTILSIYFVFARFFNKSVGMMGALLYTFSYFVVTIDRWVVPSMFVFLWSVWYLFTLLSIVRGNTSVFPLVALLFGLSWHIHPSLFPLIFLMLPAFAIGKTLPTLKQFITFILILLGLLLPYFVFEIRHQWSLTQSLLDRLSQPVPIENWGVRVNQILGGSALMFISSLIPGLRIPFILQYLTLALTIIFIVIERQIKMRSLWIILSWFMLILLSQLFSGRPVSQYYFHTFVILTLLIFAITIAHFYTKKTYRYLIFVGMSCFILLNVVALLGGPEAAMSFAQKNAAVDFIASDIQQKKYPCAGIDYIADFGIGVGFNYLFWWKKVPLIKPVIGVPLYKLYLPLPLDSTPPEVDSHFGRVGVIVPEFTGDINSSLCSIPANQLEQIWGFTK